MTPEEHDHLQALEAKMKRYRSRIALLKDALIVVAVNSPCDGSNMIRPNFEWLSIAACCSLASVVFP